MYLGFFTLFRTAIASVKTPRLLSAKKERKKISMNLKKTYFSVLCVLILFSSCLFSVVHAETAEDRETLDFIYRNRENLTGESKRIILIARIVNPEKMKEYEDKFIWDDDGLLTHNNANIAVLGEIIANIDTNGYCSRRLE